MKTCKCNYMQLLNVAFTEKHSDDIFVSQYVSVFIGQSKYFPATATGFPHVLFSNRGC